MIILGRGRSNPNFPYHGGRLTGADRRDFGLIWVEDGTEDRGLVGDNRVAGAGKVGEVSR